MGFFEREYGLPGIERARERYERWWLGKKVLLRGMDPEDPPPGWPKRVVKVEMVGPPSFVYGDVWLHFEDGTNEPVRYPPEGVFRPRKKDVIVVKEDE